MSRRVVVTGMGAITPIGLSVEEFWEGVKEGKTGFFTTDFRIRPIYFRLNQRLQKD